MKSNALLHPRTFVLGPLTLFLLLLCGPLPLVAANGEPPPAVAPEPSPYNLDTIVVTATGEPTPLLDTPYTVNTVTAETIVDRQVRTLPDALRETPGVMVQKTGNGQGSPYIRGFTGFRNLLLIDGIRLNNSVFRDGPNQYWNTVDPLSLRTIEVVKSQGATIFGSDSIGGTVNALTKSALPADDEPGRFFVHGDTSYRWSSAEQSHIGRLEAQVGKAGEYGLHVGFSLKDFGDLRAAELGALDHTGYSEWDLDTKFQFQLREDTLVTLAYQQVEQNDAWRTHKTLYSPSWHGTTVGSEQKRSLDQTRRLAYAQVHSQNVESPLFQEMRLSLSWHNQEEETDRVRKPGDDRRDLQGFEVNTLGLWSNFTAESPIGLLTYGASWYRDWVDSHGLNFAADGTFLGKDIQGPVGDDSVYDLFSLFLEDRIEPAETVDVFLGGNFTYARADIGRAEDPLTGDPMSIHEHWANFSASLRGVWDVTGDETWNVFGGISQGFRAPNLSDLSRFDTARTDEIETPSPGLDPEQFVLTELGVRFQTERFRASASYYYTFIEDMIVRAPTGRILDGNFEVTKRNSGRGFVQGIELESQWRFHPQWEVFGNLTWMDGSVDTYPTSDDELVREPLDRLMPLTGNLTLRWTPFERFWIELWGTAAAKADRLSTRDQGDTERIPPGGTPGYAIVSLRAGFDVNRHLSFQAAIENLTDQDYRIHGSGQNEAGRNFVLTGRLIF